MKRGNVFLNSIMSFIAQLVMILSQFFVRSFFIKYIGEEMLGLDATILSVLNMFSLAEAGLSSAMIVFLVRPLQEDNQKEVNRILNTFRIMYQFIGGGYLIAALLFAPFLRFFITGIEVGPLLYLYYGLLAVNGALTYFLSYRKVLLFADQRMYLQKLINAGGNLLFCLLQTGALALGGNYLVYIVLKISQTFGENLFIYLICGKRYWYLQKQQIDRAFLAGRLTDMKNLFVGQVAGYIYGSSDALVISKVISTVQVAYYNNYYLVMNGLKTLLLSLFQAAVPMLKGHMVRQEKKEGNEDALFWMYTHIGFLLASLVVVPAYCLIEPFMAAWVGEKFLLGKGIFFLMATDLYVCVLQNPLGDYIIAQELFAYSKYPDMAGAVINIVLSVFLSVSMGVEGVLYGTVISRMIQWGVRGTIAFRYCLGLNGKEQLRYWLCQGYQGATLVIMAATAGALTRHVRASNFVLEFIIKGLAAEIIVLLGMVVFYWNSKPQQGIWRAIRRRGKGEQS